MDNQASQFEWVLGELSAAAKSVGLNSVPRYYLRVSENDNSINLDWYGYPVYNFFVNIEVDPTESGWSYVGDKGFDWGFLVTLDAVKIAEAFWRS